jgi:1-acylglycerone phosphate reductase
MCIYSCISHSLLADWMLSTVPFGGAYAASKAAVRSLSDTLDMELRPLNVRVMLIEPGAIKSNIGENNVATFGLGLPSTSLYRAFESAIITRLTFATGPNATPSSMFAKQVVDGALQSVPPKYFSSGHTAMMAWIASWLPRNLRLAIAWSRFSKLDRPL